MGVFAGTMACAAAFEPTHFDLPIAASWIMDRARDKHDIAGISVAVVNAKGVVWSGVRGWANTQTKLPLDRTTKFRIGSVSKLFTTTAMMKLVEQGRIDLDAPVRDVLPEFSFRARTRTASITARHLLTHHSGLPSDHLAGMFADKTKRFDTVLEWLPKVHVSHPPDTVFSYSNVGFDVLGCMIERASGERFEDYMRAHVFEPLEMTSAGFVGDGADGSSRGHKDAEPRSLPALRSLPAGGIVASAEDVGRLLAHYLARPKGDVLSRTWRRQNAATELDFDLSVGLSWFILARGTELKGVDTLLGHPGDTIYFSAETLVSPEDELGVVVLYNTRRPRKLKLANEIMAAALQARTDRVYPPATARKPGTKLEKAPNLKGFVGLYAATGAVGRLSRRGGGYALELRHGDEVDRLTLVPRSDGVWTAKAYLLGLIPYSVDDMKLSFETVDHHRVIVSHLPGGRRRLLATRVEPRAPSSVWKQRAGKYRRKKTAPGEISLFKNVRLEVIDGQLIAHAEASGRPASFLLDPIDDAQAIVAGYGRSLGETIYATDDGVSFAGMQFVRKSGTKGKGKGKSKGKDKGKSK